MTAHSGWEAWQSFADVPRHLSSSECSQGESRNTLRRIALDSLALRPSKVRLQMHIRTSRAWIVRVGLRKRTRRNSTTRWSKNSTLGLKSSSRWIKHLSWPLKRHNCTGRPSTCLSSNSLLWKNWRSIRVAKRTRLTQRGITMDSNSCLMIWKQTSRQIWPLHRRCAFLIVFMQCT